MLQGLKVLLVFHSFRHDRDSFALLADVRNLGSIQPLNLLYVAAWLRKHGAEVSLLDCNALDLDLEEALERAAGLNFDFVGFTVTNLDFLFAIRFVKAFHRRFGKPVIVGGAAAENYPREIAAIPEVAAAFHAPAESCLVEWLDAYRRGAEWWRTPGTCCRREDAIHFNPAALVPRDFSRPWPDRTILPDKSLYYSILSKGSPFTAAMSVYGCPYGCEFCGIRRTRFDARSAEDIVGEMEWCEKELGISELDYFDSNFTVPRERALRIAELYRRRGLTARWSARSRVDRVDGELLDAMRSANCRWLGYGVEAGDDGILAGIDKKQGGRSAILRNLGRTKEAGIDVVGFFVLGLPGEDEETLRRTLDFIAEAPLDYVQISPFWPVPSTPIYERIVRETGVDVWRRIITEGPQPDLPLDRSAFSLEELHAAASRAYGEFYLRPAHLWKLAGNVSSLRQFRRYLSAGLDVARGVLPLRFGEYGGRTELRPQKSG